MKKLIYLFLTVLIVACSSDNGGGNNQSACNGDNPVYLADNGITIKACSDANVGDTGVIDGVTYTVVDEAMLREMVANEQDVTRLATTKVTEMSFMFLIEVDIPTDFNQDISNWDVSNVTNMYVMFWNATAFNQDISNWDVSNVTDMETMFWNATAFNQPIGNWDVSNVTYKAAMFWNATAFNQPIGAWDVSNVTDMEFMFENATSFNQNLSSWSVDDVSSCTDFSEGAPLTDANKPIFTNCTP